MQIIRLEVKDLLRKQLIRICLVSLPMALLLLIYYQFKPHLLDFSERLAVLPPELLQLMGMGSEINIIKITYFFSYLMIAGNILLAYHALSMGADALIKEEKRGNIYYLLSKPVGRTKVVLCKYLVNLMAYAFQVFILFLVSAVFVMPSAVSRTVQIKWLQYNGEVLAGTFFLGAIFMSLGFLYSSVLSKERETGDYSFYTILILLFTSAVPGILRFGNVLYTMVKGSGLSILDELSLKTKFLMSVSPLEWLNPVRVMQGGYDTRLFLFCTLLAAGLLGISLICYNRRDFR